MDTGQTQVCDHALTQVFSLLGKRWTGMIIGVLLEGPLRFAELSRSMPSITDGMLSSRLGELREVGLVERQIIEGPPVATIYRLTPRGQALRPALVALTEWARVHMAEPPASAAAERS